MSGPVKVPAEQLDFKKLALSEPVTHGKFRNTNLQYGKNRLTISFDAKVTGPYRNFTIPQFGAMATNPKALERLGRVKDMLRDLENFPHVATSSYFEDFSPEKYYSFGWEHRDGLNFNVSVGDPKKVFFKDCTLEDILPGAKVKLVVGIGFSYNTEELKSSVQMWLRGVKLEEAAPEDAGIPLAEDMFDD